ncbi:MAG: glycosyltransferase family 2 protein [Proteobacteria bacterium]|nr:glycosyltransferase family 2 protein [Pseudomonadota bacterium]
MLDGKTIAVVLPAYNEEKQIGTVIETLPDFVDRIVVVNDASRDATSTVVQGYIDDRGHGTSTTTIVERNTEIDEENRYLRAESLLQQRNEADLRSFTPSEVANRNPDRERIILINHLKNGRKGAAVATGYLWCRNHGIDCTAIMDGDGQMDPAELESICRPVVEGEADYVKGNRLVHRSAPLMIPKVRYFGNSILSILTKIASGYWHVSDTQTGYTAISKEALGRIELHKIYRDYGVPNDILVKLNIASCTIKEIEIKPVYQIGETSKMSIPRVVIPIAWLLFKSFFKRLWIKYLFKDFHPLFLLYHFSFVLGLAAVPYAVKILRLALIPQPANPVTVLAFVFLFISGFQSLLFAMWMDIQANERLYK